MVVQLRQLRPVSLFPSRLFFLISIPDVSLEITRTPGGWRPIISPFILILNIQVLLKWEIGFGPF